jgi:hypothetical protein
MVSPLEEKGDRVCVSQDSPKDRFDGPASHPMEHVVCVVKDPDQAYHFLQKAGRVQGEDELLNLQALRRKIDQRILPIMFCCYTIQFIDKVSLNVGWITSTAFVPSNDAFQQHAAVIGINKDLRLKGNDFSNALSAFFITNLIAEVPNGEIHAPAI